RAIATAVEHGPSALSDRQKLAFLTDPLMLSQLHLQVSTSPAAHPSWRAEPVTNGSAHGTNGANGAALGQASEGDVEHVPLRSDDARVEQRAVFRRALLRLEVDVHDAEALRVAVRPLEVVEQRPHEVSPHVYAAFDRRVDGLDVRAEIVDAQRVRQTVRFDRRWVEEGGAILRDVER